MNRQRAIVTSALLLWVPISGTACLRPHSPNKPLERLDPTSGYRFESLELGEGNTDDTLILVSFSGGGTRAAAFAYGVLLGLDDTSIPATSDNEPQRTLLDEVDTISSVSGGSFTAMAYGLWGKQMFDGRFRRRFLERNVQFYLLLNLLLPRNLIRIPSFVLDTSDIAANYYHQRIFDELTYRHLLDRKRRPLIVVNATDLSRRQRFAFTQEDFDLLGSSLESLPVAWAVAASSAFPILLSPLRLEYFHSDALQSAVDATLSQSKDRASPRRTKWAESLLATGTNGAPIAPRTTDPEAHRYLYLMDGGISDNLGVTHFIESFRVGAIRRLIEQGRVRRLVVIIVDAGTDPPENLERQLAAPGIFTVGERVASAVIYTHSAALSAMARYAILEAEHEKHEVALKLREMIAEECPSLSLDGWKSVHDMEGYVVDIDFYKVDDHGLMKDLLTMVTSFFLPVQDVQKLIDAGRDVTRNHPEIQRLLRDLEKDAAAGG